MDSHEYYNAVYPNLERAFERSSWVLASGTELIARGWNPDGLLVTVEPVKHLHDLSVGQGLEVYVPIVGRNNDSILFPFDYEIFLKNEGAKLYASKRDQTHYFRKHIAPVSNLMESYLMSKKVPFLLDLTPSGGHFLFHAIRGTEGWKALESIGYLEPELKEAYDYVDPSGEDLKRQQPIGHDAGRVFSGMGRIAEYLSLKFMKFLGGGISDDGFEVTICDAAEKSVNLDLSWSTDPAYMRIMRSPCGLHKKIRKYRGHPPLADVKSLCFDGHTAFCPEENLDVLLNAMWDLEHAASHNNQFPGWIPYANEGLAELVNEYKGSGLYKFHQDFDATEDLPKGEARKCALRDPRLGDKTKDMICYPNSRMLEPSSLKKFLRNFMENGWKAKNVGNVISECYGDSNHGWGINWKKYIKETRANSWARLYGSNFLLEEREDLT